MQRQHLHAAAHSGRNQLGREQEGERREACNPQHAAFCPAQARQMRKNQPGASLADRRSQDPAGKRNWGVGGEPRAQPGPVPQQGRVAQLTQHLPAPQHGPPSLPRTPSHKINVILPCSGPLLFPI